jgi:hypothetical protein
MKNVFNARHNVKFSELIQQLNSTLWYSCCQTPFTLIHINSPPLPPPEQNIHINSPPLPPPEQNIHINSPPQSSQNIGKSNNVKGVWQQEYQVTCDN